MADSTLDAFLNSQGLVDDQVRIDVVSVVRQIAKAAIKIRTAINQGALVAAFGQSNGHLGSRSGPTKDINVHVDTIMLDAMRSCPVALYASRELESPVILNPVAGLAVAVDPLAGSADIDTNGPLATIFSIMSIPDAARQDPMKVFLQTGRSQQAAGFIIYGPQLAMALTLGSGTHIFTFSTRLGVFVQTHAGRPIPARAHQIAIDGSNYRSWHEAVRLYVDDCLKGVEGPREREFQLRWTGFAVAEAFRILMRGGIFLDPADFRQGSSRGHVHLVFEANPMAMLVEQAGGSATDTVRDILDLVPESLTDKTPLVFGSSREVARVARYHTEPSMIAERSPLFGNRGLFRV